ncbi:MAG: iron complex transport system substrate-binding protein [Cognaticolwellia sp.]|jgi:iron complex transport system substrate-binding protein
MAADLMDAALIDARGQALLLPRPPQRIVSLVPSTTETLFALGLGDRVVGVTRFCESPAQVKGLSKVGGTKDVELDRLLALQPDLVIGNVEENSLQIAEQVGAHFPLWMAFPKSVDDALQDLRDLGEICGVSPAAERWVARIQAARASLKPVPFTYLYLIWRKPWMAAGQDCFISALLEEFGGENLVPGRYPELDLQQMRDLDPERVLLSSEPFPFAEKHRAELEGLETHLVDGALCSWHGVRLERAFLELGGQLQR